MRTQVKVAAMIVGVASSVALAGTAFAHGQPSVHVNSKAECNVSVACGNLSHDLNKNKTNVLSGNLNKNNVASGNNVNAPVTADVNCNAVSAVASQASTLCLGNFHKIKAGQKVGN